MTTSNEYTSGENDQDKALIAAAKEAMGNAYAHYSHFSVGAAVRTKAGKIYNGCNVENVSYPVGVCAERNAISAAVAAEGPDMEIDTLALVARNAGADVPCSPCGACRQAIGEFGSDAEILYRWPGTEFRRRKIAELLPDSFTFTPSAQS